MKENKQAKIKPYNRLMKSGWRQSPLVVLTLAVGLLCGSCGPIKHLPDIPTGKTEVEVNLKDSTILHYIDSIRITDVTRYKDYASLLDTLSISSDIASMRAWADTTHNLIAGELKTEPVKQKTRIVYKEKIVYKDSARVEEKPVPYPVEVEKKVVPKFWKFFGIIGMLLSILLVGGTVLYFVLKAKPL